MQQVSFLHISDLHLDNFPSVKKENDDIAIRLHEAPYEALQNLINLCEQLNPQFIVCTGDLYQHGLLSLKARVHLTKFFKELEKKEIPFYYVCGNQDHLGQNDTFFNEFPLVFIYGNTWSSFMFPPNETNEEKRICLTGISQERRDSQRNLLESFTGTEKALFNIGLLHATVNSSEKIKKTDKHVLCLCKEQNFYSLPVDYWALGHIHEHTILCEKPMLCYAGAMQATRMSETHAKGVIFVTIDNLQNRLEQKITTQFYPISTLEYYDVVLHIQDHDMLLDIKDVQNFFEEQFDALISALPVNQHCTDKLINVILEGQHSLTIQINDEKFIAELYESFIDIYNKPRIYIKKIRSFVRPCFNFDMAYKRDDILGAIFRTLEEVKQNPQLFEEIFYKIENEFNLRKEYELGFFAQTEMRSEKQLERYREQLIKACENISVNILEPK